MHNPTQKNHILLSLIFFIFQANFCMEKQHPYIVHKENKKTLKGLHLYTAIHHNDAITEFNTRVSNEFKNKILEPFLISPFHTMKEDCCPSDYTTKRLQTLEQQFNNNLKLSIEKYLNTRLTIVNEGVQLAWYYACIGCHILPCDDYFEQLSILQKYVEAPLKSRHNQ